MGNITNVKEIAFRAKMTGFGIVQTDTAGQKKRLFGKEGYGFLTGEDLSNDNIGGFSKKNFYGDGHRIKITADCIKKNLRGDIVRPTSDVDAISPHLMVTTMAEPINLLTGWLSTKKETLSVKKKSALTMTDAEQINDASPNMEIATSTDVLPQNSKSFRYSEAVGDMEYEIKHGSINLKELQFIPCDEIADRQALTEEHSKLMPLELQRRFSPNHAYEVQYYRNVGNVLGEYIAERGIVLPNADINSVVKDFLKKLVSLSIMKRNAFAKVCDLEVAFVTNPFEPKKWVKLASLEDVDKVVSFEVHPYYDVIPVDEMDRYNVYIGKLEAIGDAIRVKQKDDKEKKRVEKAERMTRKKATEEARQTQENVKQ